MLKKTVILQLSVVVIKLIDEVGIPILVENNGSEVELRSFD